MRHLQFAETPNKNPAKRNVKLWVQRQDHKKKKLRELKLQASKDKRTAKFFGKLAGTH
jgi:hypothetical protein